MKLDSTQYQVFCLADSGRHVAIDREQQKVIEHCLSIWKELQRVPADRTVRGIFVMREGGNWSSVNDTLQQNDITLSQLRPVDAAGTS